MRKLSFWAKRNPWAARIIIVCGHIILTLLAWYIGTSIETSIHPSILYGLAFLFILTIFLYPSKQKRRSIAKALAYRWQKTCDFMLQLFTFCMISSIANNYISGTLPGVYSYAATNNTIITKEKNPTAEEILATLSHRDKKSLTKIEKRILRKEFKKQLKVYAAATLSGKKDDAGKALLIILAIIAALGLLYLLAALACSISCGGAEGAAIVVFILGTAAIAVGTVFVIKAIVKSRRKEVE